MNECIDFFTSPLSLLLLTSIKFAPPWRRLANLVLQVIPLHFFVFWVYEISPGRSANTAFRYCYERSANTISCHSFERSADTRNRVQLSTSPLESRCPIFVEDSYGHASNDDGEARVKTMTISQPFQTDFTSVNKVSWFEPWIACLPGGLSIIGEAWVLSARLECYRRGLSIVGEAWVLTARLECYRRGMSTIGEAWVLSARLEC